NVRRFFPIPVGCHTDDAWAPRGRCGVRQARRSVRSGNSPRTQQKADRRRPWVRPASTPDVPFPGDAGVPSPWHRLRLVQPRRGHTDMIIDRETFTELAVHLKLASDAVLTTARHLAVLSNGNNGPEENWAGTLDSLMAMNSEITVMERILRALM